MSNSIKERFNMYMESLDFKSQTDILKIITGKLISDMDDDQVLMLLIDVDLITNVLDFKVKHKSSKRKTKSGGGAGGGAGAGAGAGAGSDGVAGSDTRRPPVRDIKNKGIVKGIIDVFDDIGDRKINVILGIGSDSTFKSNRSLYNEIKQTFKNNYPTYIIFFAEDDDFVNSKEKHHSFFKFGLPSTDYFNNKVYVIPNYLPENKDQKLNDLASYVNIIHMLKNESEDVSRLLKYYAMFNTQNPEKITFTCSETKKIDIPKINIAMTNMSLIKTLTAKCNIKGKIHLINHYIFNDQQQFMFCEHRIPKGLPYRPMMTGNEFLGNIAYIHYFIRAMGDKITISLGPIFKPNGGYTKHFKDIINKVTIGPFYEK